MTPTQTDTTVRLLHDARISHAEHTWIMALDALRAEDLTEFQSNRLGNLSEKYPAKSAKRRRQF